MGTNYEIGDIIKYTGGDELFRPEENFIVVRLDILSYRDDFKVNTVSAKTGEPGLMFYDSNGKVIGFPEHKAVKISD